MAAGTGIEGVETGAEAAKKILNTFQCLPKAAWLQFVAISSIIVILIISVFICVICVFCTILKKIVN